MSDEQHYFRPSQERRDERVSEFLLARENERNVADMQLWSSPASARFRAAFGHDVGHVAAAYQ
jgi:hypothetical protein